MRPLPDPGGRTWNGECVGAWCDVETDHRGLAGYVAPMGMVPLAAELLRGADWFNDSLLAELEARGWPALSRNQSQLFPLLTDIGVSQSEIARRLGITRQSVSALVRELVEFGILAVRSDDRDARLVLVVLTDRGRDLADDASRILRDLETLLVDRIGRESVDALRAAVSAEWGPAPLLTGRPPQ